MGSDAILRRALRRPGRARPGRRGRTRRVHAANPPGAVKLGDAPGPAVVLVRPPQRDGRAAGAVGQLDLGENEGNAGPGLPDRDVADLAALSGVPAEPGAVTGPDGVLHVRVGPGLVELVVERRRHVLPGLVEDGDAVPVLGVHADGVVDGGA